MIESPTIDEPLVERLLAAQFPAWTDLPVRRVAEDGWDNRSFRLGDELVVRLPSAQRYAAQVEKEQRWLPRLRPHLPLPIPEPVARGAPSAEYPWPWSVYRWIEGAPATSARIDDRSAFAADLAAFLVALRRVDASGAPAPGAHNFHRGAEPIVYDDETRAALVALDDEIDATALGRMWAAALAAAPWRGAPVWLHGDVSASNLLVRDGRLAAVIDFGGCAVGDPACDLTIAWTFLDAEPRATFRDAIGLDEDTWARARGWAAWKALITLREHRDNDRAKADAARAVLSALLAEPSSR